MTTGRLIGIAWRKAVRAPIEEIAEGAISFEAGLAGHCKGARYPSRQITPLSREDCQRALAELGSVDLPWAHLPG